MSTPDDATVLVPEPGGEALPPPDSHLHDLLRIGAKSHRQTWEPPTVEALQAALPQFEITGFLAQGAMGAVFKGVQKSLHRTVAIKVLRPDADDVEMQYAGRFKHEAQAMAHLSHPGIVSVFDAGETPDGLLYFAMEFVEGTDVAQIIARDGRLDPQRAVSIAIEVCDALSFAHGNGIIHRDVKPSNVMLDTHGRVKVADFGLAKIIDGEATRMTLSNMTMGTPDFAAPEAMIPGVPLDQRADLYSVGVMLYQMLTGRIPRGRFDAPSGVIPQIDPGLDAIVDRAMQTDREKRYATALEMRADLERVSQKGGTIPPRTGTEAPQRRSASKVRLLLVAGIIAALTVAGWAWWHTTTSSRPVAAGATTPTASRTGLEIYPAGQWAKAFPSPEAIPNIGQSDAGWVRCTPGFPDLFAPSGRGGHQVLRDAGVRVRFRGQNPTVARWAKLEIRVSDQRPLPSFRYLPPEHPGQPGEIRIEIIYGGGREFRTLASAAVDVPIQENEEFTMEFYAIGKTLTGRLNQQTLTARFGEADAPTEGALGIWGADRNFFRDLEVLNLEGLSETEARRFAGIAEESL